MGSLNGKIFQFWLQLVLYWNCYYYWMNCYEKKSTASLQQDLCFSKNRGTDTCI